MSRRHTIMATAHLINAQGYIASIYSDHKLKPKQAVRVSYQRCVEHINADRDYILVNAFGARVSYSNKYDKKAMFSDVVASEINPGEVFLTA